MNCLYNVLPGKLEVIILITLINSGETDSPTHKSSSTFYNCASDVENHLLFSISFCFFSTNIPNGMAVQLPPNNR